MVAEVRIEKTLEFNQQWLLALQQEKTAKEQQKVEQERRRTMETEEKAKLHQSSQGTID